MREKHRRQAALMRLVRRRALANQEQMVRGLRELGFRVTQASISRDVRELGLVRLGGRYVPAGAADAENPDAARAAFQNELIIAAEPVGANLVVVHTPPGAANTVAIDLDRQRLPEVVGTLAGDDTVFVAVRSRAAQGRFLARIRGPASLDAAPADDERPPGSATTRLVLHGDHAP